MTRRISGAAYHRVVVPAVAVMLFLVGCVMSEQPGGEAVGATEQADKAALSEFYGRWIGSGVLLSRDNVKFKRSGRDLNVTIHEAGKGFTLYWTTVRRKRDKEGKLIFSRATTSSTFVPTRQPNVWRDRASLDPIAGKVYSWARLQDRTLTVNRWVIEDDGKYEMQIYKRTLDKADMGLEFLRLQDGQIVRAIKGRLVKFADATTAQMRK